MENVGLDRGYVAELPHGELTIVLAVLDDEIATVSTTASYDDAQKVKIADLKVVFPTAEMLDRVAKRRRHLHGLTVDDPLWTNDRVDAGALADIALEIEFAWPNGREVYELVYSLYRGIKKSNLKEHRP